MDTLIELGSLARLLEETLESQIIMLLNISFFIVTYCLYTMYQVAIMKGIKTLLLSYKSTYMEVSRPQIVWATAKVWHSCLSPLTPPHGGLGIHRICALLPRPYPVMSKPQPPLSIISRV